MKTAYEWLSLSYKEDRGDTFAAIAYLITLSKKVPWLLDPKVKFQEFDLRGLNEFIVYIETYNGPTYVGINTNICRGFIKDPHIFRKRIHDLYRAKPGWIQIENGI